MKHHELEALRRLLFFSVPEAAALIGDVSEQAWRRWESGSRAVPEDVAQQLLTLADWRQSAIDAAARQIGSAPSATTVAVIWYATLDEWASLPGREPALWRPQQSVASALFADFAGRVKLVTFDGPVYSAWRAAREDSEPMRAAWAAAVL